MKDKVEIKEKTIQIKKENEGLSIYSDNTKSKMSPPSLDSTHKRTKSHTCSICDYTTSHKGAFTYDVSSLVL